MAYKNVDNIIIENAHIIFKNFKRRGIEVQPCWKPQLLCHHRRFRYGAEAD